ncbi:MAG: hypothetical protein II821_03930 [Treponema sp.]|nr:hypothetical protein [Treponema sp.]
MADFDITVDTSPMANSLDHVNSNVRDVTSSVVAMQSAVVIAQQRASEQICQNVDTGFFVLMKSQFDQKIAAVSSKMLSTMQLMETFKGDIDKIMVIMQDDYERIKARYFKHFSSLDKALETRIHELDKRAYEISRNYKMSQFKTGSEVIKAICYSNDTQMVNVKQANATVKSKSTKSIGVMAENVIEQMKYSDSVQSILKEIEFEAPREEYVPVIFAETDSMMSEDSSVKNVVTSTEAAFSVNSKYLNQLKESSENFSWKEINDAEFEPIKTSFQQKVNSEVSDERVAREMLRLFDASKWQETEA